MINEELYTIEQERMIEFDRDRHKECSHIYSGNLFLAIHSLNRILNLNEEMPPSLRARVMLFLAYSYEENDNVKEAIHWYKKCLSEPTLINDKIYCTAIIKKLITNLVACGDLKDIEDYLCRIPEMHNIHEPDIKAQLIAVKLYLRAIYAFHLKKLHHSKIEKLLFKSKLLFEKNSNSSLFPFFKMELEEFSGDLSNHINDFNSAVEHYHTALSLSKAYQREKTESALNYKLSSIYEREGNYKLALEKYKRHYRLLEEVCRKKSRKYSEYLMEIWNLGYVENSISHLKKMSEKLVDKRNTDFLTGTYNRRFWDETIRYKIENREYEPNIISILMVDIDNFKKYNDDHGHLKGDETLIKIADLLKSSVGRSSDIVARYGGEEFIILLNSTGVQGSKTIAETILNTVRKQSIFYHDAGLEILLSLSIGISTGPESNINALIREADKALYYSKKAGKNTHTHVVDIPMEYSQENTRSIQRKKTIVEKLEWIIFYFEGTCEICLGNRGIEKYRKEIDEYIKQSDDYTDDVKLRIFYASAVISYKVDQYELAYKDWMKALSYARNVTDPLYIGKIYSYLAIYYYIKKDMDQERHCFIIAENIFLEQQNYGELANHYINLLWFKRYEQDTRETVDYMKKALHYVRLSNSKKNARVYLHLGYIQKTVFNDFVQGIKHLAKSIELSREYGFVEMESMTMHVLADGYSDIDNYAETVNIYTSMMQDDRYKNITDNLKATVLCSLIGCYLKMQDIENAQKFLIILDQYIPKVQTNIRERYYAVFLGLKAEFFSLKKINLDQALSLIDESNKIYERYKYNFIIENFPNINAFRTGNIYLALKNYAQAISYYKSVKERISDDDTYFKKTLCEQLTQAYEETWDYKNALDNIKQCGVALHETRKKKMEEHYETMHKHLLKDIKEKEMDELNELNNTLEKDSNIDGLTELYNRSFLNKYMEGRLSNPNAANDVSVLLIDIDSFKKYNDNYGHAKGDKVLRKVADVLRRSCHNITDVIIRYGGEEFLIVMENSSKKQALELSEKILYNFELENIEHKYSEVNDFLTVSIGIATCMSGKRCDPIKVIEAADQALYCSKRNGKNQYTHIDSLV